MKTKQRWRSRSWAAHSSTSCQALKVYRQQTSRSTCTLTVRTMTCTTFKDAQWTQSTCFSGTSASFGLSTWKLETCRGYPSTSRRRRNRLLSKLSDAGVTQTGLSSELPSLHLKTALSIGIWLRRGKSTHSILILSHLLSRIRVAVSSLLRETGSTAVHLVVNLGAIKCSSQILTCKMLSSLFILVTE